MHEPKRDVVLLLGAGFSCTAGLPIMGAFGGASEWTVDALKKRHGPGGTGGPRLSYGRLHTAGTVFEAFREYCRTASSSMAVPDANMETVFSIAEVLRESGAPDIPLAGRTLSCAAIVKHIKLWLWSIYRTFPWLDRQRNGDPEPYDYLTKELAKRADLRSRLSVVTTNYDLIFEHFAFKNSLKCWYPLSGNVTQLYLGKSSASYLEWTDESRAPMVCKLHGSINLFQLPGNSDVGLCGQLVSGPIGKSLIAQDLLEVMAMDAIDVLENTHKAVPAIIPPTYAKLEGHGWLRAMWQAGLSALRNAKTIVFVGYSLPETDGFMRAMLQAAMAGRLHPPRIHVFDPSRRTHIRYRRMFRPIAKQLIHKCCDFKRACDNGELIAALTNEH